MPASVIVGGQFGSEGKGKVSHWLSQRSGAAAAVRVGGPNSGHTVISEEGKRFIFRQLPTAAIVPGISCLMPAGSYIIPELLLQEIAESGIDPVRVVVDPNAWIIGQDEIAREGDLGLARRIGSTGSGTGAAILSRIERLGIGRLAKNDPRLSNFVAPVSTRLRGLLAKKERIVIEGTQGFGLSLFHSENYPYVTSRDTSAAAFVSEAGISPLDVDEVVLVLRSFPIRVSGSSGPLPRETTWETISSESRSPRPLIEHTTVTKKVRRVARFDKLVVQRAMEVNQPSRIVLNHLDYIDAKAGAGQATDLVREFVASVEHSIGTTVDLLGFSPQLLVERSKA